MKHTETNIKAFVKSINHQFFLPAIQRKFVWNEKQICKLFDSILRRYPFGSFLIWRTDSNIRKRKFVEEWQPKGRQASIFEGPDTKAKALVLDGQQRIQSMVIGLKGKIGNKSLHFNILSPGRTIEDTLSEKPHYEFEFMPMSNDWRWVPVPSIINSAESVNDLIRRFQADAPKGTPIKVLDKASDNISTLHKLLTDNDSISYQLLDSIENRDRYEENDVLEIFVRANSGGTKLEKSELLFALLSTNWDSAETKLDELERDLSETGYAFKRDYFLKACLILLGKKAQYDVKKFRERDTLKALEENWKRISDAITDVVDFLPNFTPIANSKALPSANALLPLIAYRYFQPKGWKSDENKRLAATYLLRTSIASTYNGAKDNLIDALVEDFSNSQGINLDALYKTIESKGRALRISSRQLFKVKYSNKRVMLIMKLLRPDLNFLASNRNNLPTVDHLISRKLLKTAGITSSDEVDQLANLVALSAIENQGIKGAQSIQDWLRGKKDADRKTLIRVLYLPEDQALWTPERYSDFIEARKKLIAAAPEIKNLLSNGDQDQSDDDDDDENGY